MGLVTVWDSFGDKSEDFEGLVTVVKTNWHYFRNLSPSTSRIAFFDATLLISSFIMSRITFFEATLLILPFIMSRIAFFDATLLILPFIMSKIAFFDVTLLILPLIMSRIRIFQLTLLMSCIFIIQRPPNQSKPKKAETNFVSAHILILSSDCIACCD